MKFSVLLSVYAGEQPGQLAESLGSIFRQTVMPAEVVLVADGPLTPPLEEVIAGARREHPQLTVVRITENVGLGLALREGLAHCTCDVVARMDSDDVAMSDRFEVQTAWLEAHPETDVVGGWVAEFAGTVSHVVSIRRVPETHGELLRFSRRRNPMNHPAVMFRKAAVTAAGGYQHCPLFEDYDLWVRMFLRGSRFHNLQRPLLYFRLSDQMFGRRGGRGYICREYRFHLKMWREGHITLWRLAMNLAERTLIRALPNSWRKKFYLFWLRR